MTEHGDEGGVDVPGDRRVSLVLAAFDDPEPLTAREVADEVGIDPDRAATALDELVTAGRVGRKRIDGRTVWYPTPGAGNGHAKDHDEGAGEATDDWSPDEVEVRGSSLDDDFDESRVEAAIADLEVPGTSEMMRDWRRGAVRAAFDRLREEGEAPSRAIVDAVYPGNPAGYSDREEWWAFVADCLGTLPGVRRDGDRWEFVGVE